MSRALAAAIVVAFALALGLAPGPGPLAAAPAKAADCNWQRHSKLVVKQVKREGRVRRVVRRKHWWSCKPMPIPAPLVVPTPPAPPASPPPTPEPEPAVARLSVKALEFSFTLSRPSVAAGEVIVELNNQGEDPHNLYLQREDSENPALQLPEAGPQERRVARFALAEGSYRLWCSLPQHEEWGMSATLAVGSG